MSMLKLIMKAHLKVCLLSGQNWRKPLYSTILIPARPDTQVQFKSDASVESRLAKNFSMPHGNPTNSALIINFQLSSDGEILLRSADRAYKLAPNIAKSCMQCVHIPTELPFCIPPLVVGYKLVISLFESNFGVFFQ